MLEDKRVDLDIEDEDGDGKTIENMLPKDIDPLKISRANKFFQDAKTRKDMAARNKIAIFVINTQYKAPLNNLEGPLHDLEIARKVFAAQNYSIHVIENSKDILTDVLDLIENEGLEGSDAIQLVYSGHGVHKTSAEKGKFQTETENKTNYGQSGELGDCLVNTDGTLCEELLLSWEIARELKGDALMGFFYDMCRSEKKVSV